jgi:hypothetical protein
MPITGKSVIKFNSIQPPLMNISLHCSSVTINQVQHEFLGKAHLGLMKNLYWIRTVMRKNTTPSTAMAKRFRPTKSQDSGDTKRSSPGGHNQRSGQKRSIRNHGPSSDLELSSHIFLEMSMTIIHDKEKK